MQQHLKWWQDLLDWQANSAALILVTVVRADGSTPRELGASMLVGLDAAQNCNQSDTIGGGHLEFQALHIAQTMLTGQELRVRFTERFNLSARLGQCCGGVMWLLFEKITPSEHYHDFLACKAAWQLGQSIIRQVSDQHASTWHIAASFETKQLTDFEQQDASWQWTQTIQPYVMQVLIFGAGHVGEAIVRYLMPIGVQITWVDNREDVFPPDLVDQINCVNTDVPEAFIGQFDRSGAVLILTHDHQLDLRLCFEALKPNAQPFRYVGMIGSKSKRAIFEKRMQARGYTRSQLDQLICPIGIDGIHSKQPAIVAIAVVAELLQVFDAGE